MLLLRKIDYSKMLYSTLGAYFSINASGLISILYKYLLCILWPLQLAFNTFDVWRHKKQLIAYCDWKIGQLINLLNYLYDPIQNRIYISQSNLTGLFVPDLDYESYLFDTDIDSTPLTASDSLGVEGISYMVIISPVTYDSIGYSVGQTFTTINGVTNFTGTGAVIFNTFTPGIDDVYIKVSKVSINIPAELYSNIEIRSDIISTLEQIRLAGLTYNLQIIV